MKSTMAERAAQAAEKAQRYEAQAKVAVEHGERESALWMAQQFRDEARLLERGVDPLSWDARMNRRARVRMLLRKAG